MTALEMAIDKARIKQVSKMYSSREFLNIGNGAVIFCPTSDPDASEGMAWIFEDRPTSKPVACTTATFARKFCADDPYYTWRKL